MKKEIKDLFFELTNKQVRSIEEITTGFCNKNYLINNAYVLRKAIFPRDETISFENEEMIHEAIEKLNCSEKIVYFNKEDGTKISKFIHGTRFYYNTPTIEQIVYVAKLIKKIQKSGIEVPFKYDAVSKLQVYKKNIPEDLYINQTYERQVIREYQKIEEKYPLVISHNDLVKGNLLFKFNGVSFIDREYASMNNPLFDLASFISENNLSNEQQDFFLNKFFGSKYNNMTKKRIDIVIKLQDILFYYWALYQFKLKHQDIFKKIADEKYERIKSTGYSF